MSSLEQDVVARDAMAEHFTGISGLFEDPAFDVYDCLRVVMLYALRYEGNRSARVRGGCVYAPRCWDAREALRDGASRGRGAEAGDAWG